MVIGFPSGKVRRRIARQTARTLRPILTNGLCVGSVEPKDFRLAIRAQRGSYAGTATGTVILWKVELTTSHV